MPDQWRIDRALLERLCKASRIELTEEEQKRFSEQLRVILEAFRELDRVDTEGVEPSYHPVEGKNVLRGDSPREWQWDPLGNTEHREEGYFKGPRIV